MRKKVASHPCHQTGVDLLFASSFEGRRLKRAPATTSFKRRAKKTVDAMQTTLHNLVSLLLMQQRKTGGAREQVSLGAAGG
jgi:hypothetical protein